MASAISKWPRDTKEGMKMSEHDPLDLAGRMFTLCDMADSDIVHQWAGEVRDLLNELVALKRVRDGLFWLNNNIHNYGSDEFLGYLQAAIQDALPSKDSG